MTTSAIAFGVVLAGTTVWAALPFVPALRELFWPTDAAPLTMVGRDSGDITYFAEGFRAFLDRQSPPIVPLAGEATVEPTIGTLSDGARFVRVTTADAWPAITRGARGEFATVVIVDAPLVLPEGAVFAAELYARRPIRGGAGATYRAILGDAQCELGEDSVVSRWAHARGALVVAPRSVLHNRASSDERIVLGHDVRFDRLGAPCIEVAAVEMPPSTPDVSTPTDGAASDAYRWIEDDFTVPDGTTVYGRLVVHGTATLGRDARIVGSLKAHGDVSLGDGASVTSALVTRANARLGARCWIGGPVIAEGDVELGPFARVGTHDAPTTIACRQVRMRPGSRVFGRIAPREGGAALSLDDLA